MLTKRFRSPFLPIHSLSSKERILIAMERAIKGALFNCSMCGNCLLQETAYICPMLCPKGLRNGPCGSGSSESCCVDPSRPCIWHLIYEQTEARGTLDRLLEVQAPLDWSRAGHETWGTVVAGMRTRGLLSPVRFDSIETWRAELTQLLHDLRQPTWWQGDDEYHPPSSAEPVSRLQAALERGEFVVTAELSPPVGADAGTVRQKAVRLKDYIHAANVTQNPMARARMSSMACSTLLVEEGVEPVLQLTARDYNRFALQAEALGASALGIRNVLCLTGDPSTNSRGPAGGLPFDLDATQMLWILRRMRDEGAFLDGRPVKGTPKLLLGTAASPGDPMPEHEARRLEKKINAGAQFIQTQLVYDVTGLQRWLDALASRDLVSKAHILVGVGPLKSARVARFMRDKIPDIVMPARIVDLMERSEQPQETGLALALELIEEIRHLPGVSGIHLMSVGWESILPRLLQEAALISGVATSKTAVERNASNEKTRSSTPLGTTELRRA
jgi:methylenetetrahydrofolate reductase (NADPH)